MSDNVRASVVLSGNTGISPGHHKYFASNDAALSFFKGKAIHTYDDLAVVRIDPSKHGYNVSSTHISGVLSDFEDCEYLSFFNADMSKRWFHCRIVAIEYVNPKSCRIHYTIDYYATYIGDCMGSLGHAFVLRGHVKKSEDTLNRWLLAEPVNVPMTYGVDPSSLAFVDPLNIQMIQDTYCVFSASDEKENTNNPAVKVQKQGGVEFYGYAGVGDAEHVSAFIKSQTNQISTFQSMTKPLLSNVQAIKKMPAALVAAVDAIEDDVIFTPVLPGYKHAKMYSPQFLYWRLFAVSSGSNQQFDMTLSETSIGTTPPVPIFSFKFVMTGGLNATAAIFYSRISTGTEMQSQFVQQVPFPNLSIDAYQTADYTTYGMINKLALQPIGAGIGAGILGGGAIGGAIGAGVALAKNVADVYGQMPQTYQNASVATTDFATAAHLYRFEVVKYSPSSGGVKTLESFFDTFGYVINENRAVIFNARSNFTYIHTSNANIKGSVPARALEVINDMLNAGLTVWQAEIGSTSDCGN